MMNKLVFKNSVSLRNLANETLNNSEFSIPYFGETTEVKSITLVKDQGIYVMNAFRNPEVSPLKANLVTYASGYNPEKNADCWEDCYQVSNDDFAENIPLSEKMLERIKNGGDLTITLEDELIRIGA
jgi:hypothetical protein